MINCPGKTRCNTLSDCSCIQLLLLLLLPQKFVAAFNNCASLSASFTASTAAAVNYWPTSCQARQTVCPSASLGCCCQCPAALLFVLCQRRASPAPPRPLLLGYKLLYGTFGSLTKLKMPDKELTPLTWLVGSSALYQCHLFSSRPIIKPHWS